MCGVTVSMVGYPAVTKVMMMMMMMMIIAAQS